MLEVMGLAFKGGEVKKAKDGVPANIDININIDKITQKTPDGVILEFTYAVDYKPDVGALRIHGEAYCKDTPENLKKMLAEYKKAKVVPMEFGATAINMINANAGMNSIFLLRPFNLLPPFMPPLIATEAKLAAKDKPVARKK
ncbi:hypothetical protein L0Y65_06095 [Candidatus Micrarchaeota archaeon]|nr:hypothetical protein [Candidatus Micrarchaeota archaeon]